MSEGPRRVLLVDDSMSVRATVSALLEDAGWAVDEADSLASARQRLGGEAPYDAVIIDGTLPDGNGAQLVADARRTHPGARLLLFTGAQVSDGEAAPFDAVLRKTDPVHAWLGQLTGPAAGDHQK